MYDFYSVPDSRATQMLRHALALAARGWATYPATNRKGPLRGSHGVKDATRDPDRLRELFARPGVVLLAIATGRPSGISVLDIDHQYGGMDWWRENRERLPPTLAWRTRSGGLHVVFRHRPELRTVGLGVIGRGIEIRATGASVVYWPAIGAAIECNAEPARWPDWLLPPPRPALAPPPLAAWCGNDRRARAYAEGALANAIRRVASAPPGTRNATLNGQAFALSRFAVDGSLSAEEIAYALASAASRAGLDSGEVVATLKSALAAGGVA